MWDELVFDVNFQLDQIGKSVRKMEEMAGDNRILAGEEGVALAAVVLHSFYNGIESCIRLLLPNRGLLLPEGSNWHSALLDLATESSDGFDALLSESSAGALRPILGFRHVFRHAYYFDIDPERTTQLCRQAVLLWPNIKREIESAVSELG